MVANVKSGAAGAEAGTRTQNPEGTQQNIIEVATREFAEYGLAGARIDEIAA
jgi:AcrR family transcriptional regulator